MLHDASVLITQYGSQYVAAYLVSLRIALLGFTGGFLLALVLTVARISPIAPLRTLVSMWVEIFRNAPVLCLIIFIVYALPDLGVVLDYEPSVILALVLVSSAFACDNLRTGINAIDPGQVEAARAVGLNFMQIVRNIILPQSLRSVIQPMVTLMISVMISSSAGSLVPLSSRELTGLVSKINTKEAMGITTFAIAACLYVLTGLIIGFVGRQIEKRFALWQ